MTSPSLDPTPLRFSIERAAFAGLRLARREPRTLLALSLLSLAFTLVFGTLMVVTVGPTLMRLQTLDRGADPALALGLLMRFVPFQLLGGLASLFYYAVVIAAVCRAVLRPQEAGRARLMAGPDEIRQFLLVLVLGLLMFGVYLGLVIAATAVAIFIGVLLTLAGVDAAVSTALLATMALLAVLAGVVFVIVRLSLANAYTFASGRIDLRAVWRLTRGRFWPLFGAFFLVAVMMLVLGLVFLILEAGATLALGGGVTGLQSLFRPDLSSLSAYFRPLQLGFAVLGALLSGLLNLVIVGAQADAYAQIADLGPGATRGDASHSTHFGVR